VKKDIQPE
jgi:hypothetical protein